MAWRLAGTAFARAAIAAAVQYESESFGTGADGAVTFDGVATVLGMAPASNVYTLTRDIMPSSMTIAAGVTVVPAGFRIFVSGTLTNNGTISGNGLPGQNATAGAGGGSGGLQRAGSFYQATQGGANRGASSVGVNQAPLPYVPAVAANPGGAAGVGSGNGTPGTNGALMQGGSGGGGGACGVNNPAAGAGGNAGSLTNQSAITGACTYNTFLIGKFDQFAATPSFTGSGGGGGGMGGSNSGTNTTGGGGGAAGDIIAVFARYLAGTGSFQSKGGNGGNGFGGEVGHGGGGGGGGGPGGWIVLVYTTRASTLSTNVSGGAGGAGGVGAVGNGGAGGNGGSGLVVLFNVSGDGT